LTPAWRLVVGPGKVGQGPPYGFVDSCVMAKGMSGVLGVLLAAAR